MHRSSASIAAIASALAKAQGILVNPEKTIDRDNPRRPAGAGHRTKLSLRTALGGP